MFAIRLEIGINKKFNNKIVIRTASLAVSFYRTSRSSATLALSCYDRNADGGEWRNRLLTTNTRPHFECVFSQCWFGICPHANTKRNMKRVSLVIRFECLQSLIGIIWSVNSVCCDLQHSKEWKAFYPFQNCTCPAQWATVPVTSIAAYAPKRNANLFLKSCVFVL